MTSANMGLPMAITRHEEVLFYQGAQVDNRPTGTDKDGVKDWGFIYTAQYITQGDGTTLLLQVNGDGRTLDEAIASAQERLDLQGWVPYVEHQ